MAASEICESVRRIVDVPCAKWSLLARGSWEDVHPNTQMAFSTTRQEDVMCLRIAPEMAFDLSPMFYFTMEKGELSLSSSVERIES